MGEAFRILMQVLPDSLGDVPPRMGCRPRRGNR